MPVLKKETYENGSARLDVYMPNADSVWLQSGVAGLFVSGQDKIVELYELLQAYMEEYNLLEG